MDDQRWPPGACVLLAVAASLGPGLENAAIAMIIVWWPVYARLMRAQVLEVKEREHVEAALVGGDDERVPGGEQVGGVGVRVRAHLGADALVRVGARTRGDVVGLDHRALEAVLGGRSGDPDPLHPPAPAQGLADDLGGVVDELLHGRRLPL